MKEQNHVEYMTFWVVRHAQVAETGLCYGSLDLIPQMPAEVAADTALAGAAFLRAAPRRIVSSPRTRCLLLANALAARLHLAPPIILEDLRELSFGAWEGRPWTELETEPAFNAWMQHWQNARPPGGETAPELRARILGLLQSGSLAGTLAVTHAGPIRMLRMLLRGVSFEEAWSESVAHLAVESL
jgi:alpha-ribazole phosphatase